MKRTLLTVSVLALAGVALYASAGFWIAPRVLERTLQAMVRENMHLTLDAEAVTVNPFTLALSLHNVTLFRPENPPVVSLDRLDGRFRGIDFAEKILILGDLGIHALEMKDARGRPSLTVPAMTVASVSLGPAAGTVSVHDLTFERPHAYLHRARDGEFTWPGTGTFGHATSLAGDSDLALVVDNGIVTFVDGTTSTPVHLDVEQIHGSVAWRSVDRDVVASASLAGRLPGAGTAALDAGWLPDRPRESSRLRLKLENFELPRLAPYVSALAGDRVLAGRLDMDVAVSVDDSALILDTDIAVADLRLDGEAEGDGTRAVPLGTIVALLEDADGRVEIRIPTAYGRLGDDGNVASLLQASLARYLESLRGAPFAYLAGVVGMPGVDLGTLPFPPGSAEIRGDTAKRLAALGRVLELRPRLALTVFPGLDEIRDRKALARRQILLHVNLASSAGLPGQPVPASLDFEDPIVRSVLDEFAADRLPSPEQDALALRNPGRDAAYYRALFEALVDNEDMGLPALVRLAHYRARAVADALAGRDDGGQRLRVAEEIALTGPGDPAGPRVALQVREAGPESPGGSR